MPAWVADEETWERAKQQAREDHPDMDHDSDRFWQIVTTIYKRMGGTVKNQQQ